MPKSSPPGIRPGSASRPASAGPRSGTSMGRSIPGSGRAKPSPSRTSCIRWPGTAAWRMSGSPSPTARSAARKGASTTCW
ncbi:hypothetical protein G6F61_015066 [Rhizopus arrhizus]|nr:hypothetical protein G6F61_015066 [Rhizopus arrhizus]